MNMHPSNLNFNGRYVLRGKADPVNRAASVIKAVKNDKVGFFPITCGDGKIVVVATDDDIKALQEKRNDPNLYTDIKKMCSDKNNFLSNLFKMFFGTDKDALIVQGDYLARFGLRTNVVDYNTGVSKSTYRSAEHFVDGTCKEYTLRGRLCKLTTPDGRIIQYDLDGSKTITHPDGKSEFIPSKFNREAFKKQEPTPSKESKKPEVHKSEKMVIGQLTKQREPQAVKFVETPVQEIVEAPKQPQARELKKIVIPQVVQESPIKEDILDVKGRLLKRHFEDGSTKSYFYKEKSDDILFTYHNGVFETKDGVVDYSDNTVSFPYRDGIRQVFDCEGNNIAFIFPDGKRKNFDKQMRLINIVYPDGKEELFNEKGQVYLTIFPNGLKEYARRNYVDMVV